MIVLIIADDDVFVIVTLIISCNPVLIEDCLNYI